MCKGVLASLSGLMSFLILSSCTVKEDRTPCPCRLSVDVESAIPSGTSFDPREGSLLYISLYGEDSQLLSRECYDRHTLEDTLNFKVRKGYVYLVAFVGMNENHLEGNQIIIPKGMQSDEIFLSSEMVDCLDESSVAELEMRKEFTKITLKEIIVDGREEYLSSFTLVATSSSSGLDIFTSQPIDGDYYYKIPRLEDGTYTFRIPRQCDKSLSLRLLDKNGKLYGTIPLGDVLDKYGYDWDALSLEDVSVGINVPETGFQVDVEKWKESEDFKEL